MAHASQNFVKDFAVGLRYVRQRPALIYLLTLFSLTMFLLPGVAYSLVTPLVLTIADEQALGLIMSGFGIGSFIGGMMMALWNHSQRRMYGILTAMTTAGLAAILISLFQNVFVIGFGFVITGISFVFIIGLNRVIWQMKVAPDVLGRIFSLQLALGVGGQSLGVLVTGALADRIFEPLLRVNGALADSIGSLIGTGPGRGIAFMFMLVGLIELLIVLTSVLIPSIRRLEDDLPDAEPTTIIVEPAPQAI